jgi:hypothetical protein
MRLSLKHQNQNTITNYDFRGGLNSTSAQEMIAANQLAETLNMELDRSTGLLRTVNGTETVYKPGGDLKITAFIYDKINKTMFIVSGQKLYKTDLLVHTLVGDLTGPLFPVTATWEDGILIATGGKLQYYNGTTLVTLESPLSDFAYIRAGRVVAAHGKDVEYSATGDETNWTPDNNSAAAAKFAEAGYKDGGNILSLVNLSQDVLTIKDNGRLYRLSGEYPNWEQVEVSRNIDCAGRLAFCAVMNDVFILGKNELQIISTGQDYGDVKATDIARDVAAEIRKLPNNPRMVYVPPLHQIWIIAEKGKVLVYDCTYNSFFVRKFNSNVVDVVSIDDDVYVIKESAITKLKRNSFMDDGMPLKWRIKTRRIVSQKDFLVKRIQLNVTPFFEGYTLNTVSLGRVSIELPVPFFIFKIWHNYSLIYNNKAKIVTDNNRSLVYVGGDKVFKNSELIYSNDRPIYSVMNLSKEVRCTYRNKSLDIQGSGNGGCFILNSIIFDVAEV